MANQDMVDSSDLVSDIFRISLKNLEIENLNMIDESSWWARRDLNARNQHTMTIDKRPFFYP